MPKCVETRVADRFLTTRWSLVLAAAKGGEQSGEALEWLCATYWPPLYAFIRRQGHDSEAARDLTQSFFLSLLDRNSLRRIDPGEGRFRSFLLASIKHFLAHDGDRQHALKRRADDPRFRLDFDGAEVRYLRDATAGASPEEIYESRWARTVLDRALRRLSEEHEATGKGEMYRCLSGCLTGEQIDYGRVSTQLGMSQGSLRVAVHRMRRRLGVLLRAEVAHTVADPNDVKGEVTYLVNAIGRVS